MRRFLHCALLSAAPLLLSACGGSNDDIKDWMAESSRDLKGQVRPLPQIQPAAVVTYDATGLVDPFRPAKLEPDRRFGALAPDADRRREPLENYPLESLKMVGLLQKGGKVHALIQADRTLYQVAIGNYVGQNYGRVVAISESGVTLKEVVEDGNGEWGERISTLQLQEQAQQESKK
ncbi:MAG: pilus assembly protein PilP [Zoogloea sp.]|nr:pilus assembly protein PilP [Zoogloea sp.]